MGFFIDCFTVCKMPFFCLDENNGQKGGINKIWHGKTACRTERMNRRNMKQKRQHERKKGRGKLLAAVLAGVMSFAMVIPNTAYAAEGGISR